MSDHETTENDMSDTYRNKPVTIHARQWDGSAEGATPIIDWVLSSPGGHTAGFESLSRYADVPPWIISIDTLEGRMIASKGDWIIQGAQGEFYPCNPDIFAATYESVPA